MEFFTGARAVKLRSHLDKYLVADDDQERVRQSRNGSSQKARWFVEVVGDKNVIRLKSCHGTYLTATDQPFLLGMTGNKVFQTVPEKVTDWNIQWEPIRDGFQLKFKSWCGTYLRGNGGTPPWRNSVTHDEPHTGATKNWVLWDVEVVGVPEYGSVMEYLSFVSSFSSVSEQVMEALSDEVSGSDPQSPVSVVSSLKSPKFSIFSTGSPRLLPKQIEFDHIRTGMDFFHNAKVVRLRSHHSKYLLADEDEESVTQDRNGSSKNARWTVEFVSGSQSIIRLKSCYGKYLTASNQPFLLGMTGRKVLQTLPHRLDSSLEWEPVRDGSKVKLKTRYGNFLRANGGVPPWRNSVTHDIPQRTATQDWVLWDVDVIEIQLRPTASSHEPSAPPIDHSDSLDFESCSPSPVSANSEHFSRQESTDSHTGSPPKSEGRTIYYHIADEAGEVDDGSTEGYALSFKGSGVEELTQKLREDTGLDEIVVCTRSPLNGNLYPLRLQLPPNNADMHVVVVPLSSTAANDFAEQGSTLS
ncbi:hypothetical protein SLE2022_202270 [Rubroshorea leprosula]